MAGSMFRAIVTLAILLCAVSQALAAVSIKGVRGGVDERTGKRPARQNLAKFEFSGPAFDLYIQGLKLFQDQNRNDPLSFFKVSGIHGYPVGPWDGVTGSRDSGFCSHGSTLFPVWHRPYLALHEEMIWNHAQKLAATYPQNVRKRYEDAAKEMRIPYWDWAADVQMPRSLTSPKINVNTPSGLREIDNPLFTYKVDPNAQPGFPNDQLAGFENTVRCPGEDGESQNDQAQRNLRANGAYFRTSTYQLLSGERNYTVFSTMALPDRGNYNNVEILHGQIHVAIGGDGGHMTYVPWSSYDPIFWLHHTNVDRLVALWQALNPDSYVLPLANRDGNFVTEPGTLENTETALSPFRSDGKTFYTASSARSTRTFGYTYPEIEDWGVSKEDLQKNVRRKVNELYNNPTIPGLAKRSKSARTSKKSSRHEHEHSHQHERSLAPRYSLDDILNEAFDLADELGDLAGSFEEFAKMGVNNLEKQWVINVNINQAALKQAFRIHFFLGEPPKDSKTWSYASNLIGSLSMFPQMPGTPGYGEPGVQMVRGQIPLSHAIATMQSNRLIKEIDHSVIVPLLKKHLEWRIQDLSGKVIPTEDIVKTNGGKGLEVAVVERDVTPIGEDDLDQFPTTGDWTVYAEVTKGKAGGYECA
ncbi:hypothetical protein FQN57_000990 [Myotisia sp. PD_48]|nr:hypothetical protein FQN57_000990 [Myotisia sp. PD_48]